MLNVMCVVAQEICCAIVVLIAISVIYLALWYENIQASCILRKTELCYNSNPYPYRYYGTKTSYSVILNINENASQYSIKGCEPQFIYLFSRHATRYPDEDDIEEMSYRLPLLKQMVFNAFTNGKSNMCESDVNNLMNWLLKMTPADDNKISTSGEAEAQNFGVRLKQRFPALLGKEYSSNHYLFGVTSRSRTHSTARAFAAGLFGQKVAEEIEFKNKTQDELLQFHKNCKNIQKKCSKYDGEPAEKLKFEQSHLKPFIIASLSRKLGFNVSFGDVELMYDVCRFEYALEYSSPWCAVFSEDDLKLLEYQDDLDDFYKDGYGHERNYLQACPVIQYLIETFRMVINNTYEGAVLHFSHAGAIKKLFSLLGLFRDSFFLTADSVHLEERKWRTSMMCPFNANLVLVLLNCSGSHNIGAFVNEKEVFFESCNNTLCPIDKFFNTYFEIAQNCNLDKICCDSSK